MCEHSPLPPYSEDEIEQVADFARRTGLKVFPVSVADDGKKPCLSGWSKSATSAPAKIFKSCLGKAGRFGIPCKANKLLVIDCDCKNDKGNGVEQFHAYCEKYGIPLSPVWQETPSGGRHYFYRAPSTVIIHGKTQILLDGKRANVDIRAPGDPGGDGNYVASDLPGRSGYEWYGDPQEIPPISSLLVDLLKEEEQIAEESCTLPDAPEKIPQHIINNVNSHIAKIAAADEGTRNNTLYVLSCKIRRWLLPFAGEWERTESKILDAALKTGLSQKEAETAIHQGKQAGEKSGPFTAERYVAIEYAENPGTGSGFLPPLPKDAFSPRLWHLLECLALSCHSSREIALVSLLALGAQCLGHNRGVMIVKSNQKQFSNLFLLSIAYTCQGKSKTVSMATRRLREIEKQIMDGIEEEARAWVEWHRLSKKEQEEKLEAGVIPPEEFPKPQRIMPQDATMEALCELYESDPRSLLLYQDEMRGFFGGFKRYQSMDIGSANTDKILAMYDSGPLSLSRKTKDRTIKQKQIERATLTLLGNVQPPLVKDIFSSTDVEQGWPQRCVFINSPKTRIPDPSKSVPAYIEMQTRQAIDKMTDKLWYKAGNTGESVYTVFDEESEQNLFPYLNFLRLAFADHPLEDFANRFYYASLRLIHVLFFLEWALSDDGEIPSAIDALGTYRGIKLCDWCFTNTMLTFLQSQKKAPASSLQRELASIIVEHEAEIVESGFEIPSAIFREWLQKADLGRSDQFYTRTLNSLKIIAGKARKDIKGVIELTAVKKISGEALALCRKITETHPLILDQMNAWSLWPDNKLIAPKDRDEGQDASFVSDFSSMESTGKTTNSPTVKPDQPVHLNTFDEVLRERLRNTPREEWTLEDHKKKIRSLFHAEYQRECEPDFYIPQKYLPAKGTNDQIFTVEGSEKIYVFNHEGRREFEDFFAYYEARGCKLDLPPVTKKEAQEPPAIASKVEVLAPEKKSVVPSVANKDYSNHLNFCHLHLHTEASLLRSGKDGWLTIDEVMKQALLCNMKSVAITDHGNMYGAWKFYKGAKKAAINPVLGCEIYLGNANYFAAQENQNWDNISHLTLLAQNMKGFKNLSYIVSASYETKLSGSGRGIVSEELLRKFSTGLICMSACCSGEIPKAILAEQDPLPIANKYQEIFGGRFYLEIMANGFSNLQQINPALVVLSDKTGIPLVATQDVHYLDQAMGKLRQMAFITTQKHAKKNDDIEEKNEIEEGDLSFRTAREMEAAYAPFLPKERIEAAMSITGKIAESCHYDFERGKFFPSAGVENADAELDRLAMAGFEKRGLSGQEYRDRLLHELSEIKSNGFTDFFLIVADLVAEAERQKIMLGPGRGSAVGSLVCYCLGITHIDPVKFNLLFERFINSERVSLPDIDVDVDPVGRPKLLRYLEGKYEKDKVARIVNFTFYKAKSAIDKAAGILYGAGKIKFFTDPEVAKIKNHFSDKANLSDISALTLLPLEKDFPTRMAEVRLVLDFAAKLQDRLRQTGTHASGVVLAPCPVPDLIPTWIDKEERTVSQWDMSDIEDNKIIKQDLLNVDALRVVKETMKQIPEADRPDLLKLPLDDPATFELYRRGDMDGVFQMEGLGIREMLIKMNPHSFDDIVAVNAMYRPGPISTLEDYIKRKNGEKFEYLDARLNNVLGSTYGLFAYQEQIMLAAQIMAGYSLGEADSLRRIMGKKKAAELAEHKDRFIRQTIERGTTEKVAKQLFETIEKFAEYAFNKSHAVAYSYLSWQTAYLKAHFPSLFFAACLQCAKTQETKESKKRKDIQKYIRDAQAHGINIKFPAIGDNPVDCVGNGDSITLGLSLASGINKTLAEKIRKADITTLFTFIETTGLTENQLIVLVEMGYLDSLIDGRRCGIFSKAKAIISAVKKKDMGDPAGEFGFSKKARLSLPDETWSEDEKVARAEAVFGYVSVSLAEKLFDQALDVDRTLLAECPSRHGEVHFLAEILENQLKSTKQGKPFAKMLLADRSGDMKAVAFSEAIAAGPTVKKGDIIRGCGRYSADYNSLTVESFERALPQPEQPELVMS